VAQEPISVLIVDDSALMRNLIGRIIEGDPTLRVAGKAMNGRFALDKISSLQPDIVVLDLEMPEMNGIEFLEQRRIRKIDIPVIILSSIAERGAAITMEALNLSKENKYIQSVRLNGEPLPGFVITYDEVMSGGLLEFEMINQPAL